MLEVLNENPHSRYYKSRAGASTPNEQEATLESAAPAAPRVTATPGVRFAPATPVSAVRRSVISALPGAGNIPNTEGGQA
jgi:hypothetical protein